MDDNVILALIVMKSGGLYVRRKGKNEEVGEGYSMFILYQNLIETCSEGRHLSLYTAL